MLTLIKFHASWCAPCKAIAPVIEQLDADDDELIVVGIDIDENPQERANYHVRSIPTFILVGEDGLEVARKTGSASLSEMKAWVEESRG